MKQILTILFLTIGFSAFSQLTLEKDINIQSASSDPSEHMVVLNDIIYFSADDGTHGEELYQHHTLTGETSLVQDFNEGIGATRLEDLEVYNDKVYLAAKTGSTSYLYVYDPAEGEIALVRDSNNQRIRKPQHLHVFDNRLFMRSAVSNDAHELVVFDATDNSARSLGNVNNEANSNISNFNTAGDSLFFTANPADNSSSIWFYDIATDTIHQLDYTENTNYGAANQLTYIDGWLVFSDPTPQTRGRTTAINLATKTAMTFDNFQSTFGEKPSDFFPFAGKLYFSAFVAAPRRSLYSFDPATASVEKVFEINAEDNTGPNTFTAIGDKMYFNANVIVDERQLSYLYSYDPASDLFTQEGTLAGEVSSGFFNASATVGGKIYGAAFTDETATELFAFDTESSAFELIADINTDTGSADPFFFTPFQGSLYFVASEEQIGRSIWKYSPSSGNVEKVLEPPTIFSPSVLTAYDGKLYFTGNVGPEPYGLNYFDPTTNEAVETSWRSPTCTNCMQELTVFKDEIYMKAQMDEDIGFELFAYDPATDTGRLVADINTEDDGSPENLVVFQDELYFEAVRDGQRQLMKYNPTTEEVVIIRDQNNPVQLTRPEYVTAFNDKLYFPAQNAEGMRHLYAYDPANGSVLQVTNPEEGVDPRPRDLVVFEGKLHFAAEMENDIGTEFYSLDPITNEISLELDLTPGGGSASYGRWTEPTVIDDRLIFMHDTDDFGRELWEYKDGEAKIVADIYEGEENSTPNQLTAFNDKIYFAADDGDTGEELWSYASCLNVTVNTVDETEQSLGSIDVTVVGGTPPYFYTWNDGVSTEDRDSVSAGPYSLLVYDSSGCLADVSVSVAFATAIEEQLQQEQIAVFPNPNDGNFMVTSSITGEKTAYLYSLDGRIVFAKKLVSSQDRFAVQMPNLERGAYLLQVVGETKSTTAKVLIR